MTVVKTMVTGAVAMMAALMVVPVVARAQAAQSLATHRQLQGPTAPGIRKEDEAEKKHDGVALSSASWLLLNACREASIASS
jgi:hypothetical protein